MKILRLTRHVADETQMAEINRLFGEDADVETISETLPMSPREAVARFDELTVGAQVVEAVLPVNLLEAVLKFSQFSKDGGRLIRAAMNRSIDSDGNAIFSFSHYEEVEKVEIVTKRL